MMWAHTAVQSFGCVALYCRCTRIWLICLSLDVQPCSFNAHFDRPSIPCLFEGFEVFLRMHLAPSEALCMLSGQPYQDISTVVITSSCRVFGSETVVIGHGHHLVLSPAQAGGSAHRPCRTSATADRPCRSANNFCGL